LFHALSRQPSDYLFQIIKQELIMALSQLAAAFYGVNIVARKKIENISKG
jgi:hypothetical protein